LAKIVLATYGTLGDLHPFLAVALRLAESGHEVTVAATGFHRARVESAGLRFAPMRPDFAEIERDLGMDAAAGIRTMMTHDDWLFRKVLFPYIRQSWEDGLAVLEGADLVLTSPFAYGARLAAEQRGVPRIAVGLQPLSFMSAYDPPTLRRNRWAAELAARAGPEATRRLLTLGLKMAAAWAKPYQALRRELGLAPEPDDALYSGWFSSAAVVGLYSPLLGAVQPDYPAGTEIVGSAFYDSDTGGPPAPSPELEGFLAAGSPPLVFTLGSAAVEVGERFYGESLLAARRLGRRAVLLVGPDHVRRWAGLAGPDVLVAGYAPHSLLFPRAAAVVHHGGIGTSSQGLRAGVPQLVVPFLGDQPDNAARLVRLGLARSLSQPRYAAPRAAHALRALLTDPEYALHARRAAAVVAAEDGPGEVVRIAERVLTAERRPRAAVG